MKPAEPTYAALQDEIAELRAHSSESDDILRAIRNGDVDAVLAHGPDGARLFTLKGADEPYRVLIEEMNQGAVTLSADGSILFCNRRFGQLLKTPAEEMIGSAFEELVAPDERAAFTLLLEACQMGAASGEITLCAADRTPVPLQLAFGLLPVGSAAAICLIATDISESRERGARLRETMNALVQAEHGAEAARVEAERANAAKSEFLANMSHEIRTPMNGIIGMTDLVLESSLRGEQREYLGMVKTSADALLCLINDILDFSKIEAGKLELESIDFSLRDCVAGSLKPLAIRAHQKGLELVIDIPPDIPNWLIGDPMRLRQILINLTDNAIKFTARGKITVAVAKEAASQGETRLHFSVADTGIGIPEDKQSAIFGAFAQADGSTTRTYGGTGLGLAIASRIVGLMRGNLWVESAPGKGTTFRFTGHFAAGDAARAAVATQAGDTARRPGIDPSLSKRLQAGGASLRILLAEDNAINRALAAGILEKRGHSLFHAANGREAVEAAQRENFDLILMDVQMPEMDGFEATRRIREADQATGRHTPIMAMTAHAMAGDRERCLAAGMDDYVSKPLLRGDLVALVDSIRAAGSTVAGAVATDAAGVIRSLGLEAEIERFHADMRPPSPPEARLPPDEDERLAALHRYEILDTLPEQSFDDITLLASQICGAPIALISLVDETRQWMKSTAGVTMTESPRENGFCAHGIMQPGFFTVEDALSDSRFANHAFVTGEPHIRFYAGAPLMTPEGHALGMLCVIDQVPRELSASQKAALQALSRQVMAQLELRSVAKAASAVLHGDSRDRALAGPARPLSLDRPPEVVPPPGRSPDRGRCFWIARGCGLLTVILGLAVLVGWCLDFRPMMTVFPGLVSMKSMTAVSIFGAGLSLLLFTWFKPGVGRRCLDLSTGCAVAVLVLGMVVLAEYASDRNFGIDELVFRDYAASGAPGRMAPITALNCVGIGIALLLLRFPRRGAWAQALAGGVALTSLLAIVGYFYGVPSLYQSGRLTAVALHTAAGFLVLCIGVWCATSHHGFMQVVTWEGTSGLLLRRYGLAAVLSPLLLGWLRLIGERHGWYSRELGKALLAMANVATLAQLVWFGAKSLRSIERKEVLVRERLRRAHEELEQRVLLRTSELAAANADLEEQMRERARAEHANRQIMDHSLDVICTIDAEGRFLQVSRACETLWGYPAEELIARPCLDFVHPDDRQATIEMVSSIMNGQPTTVFENRYRRRDNSVIPMLWTARWSSEHRTMFCVARDITARKQLEDELLRAKDAAEASSQAKSEFLANMSHEIRTPMNGIMGMTELVLDTRLEPEQRDHLRMVKASADSLLGLINDILDFSKIEAGKLELDAISFSLRDDVGTMLKTLGMRAAQKGLELTADIRPEVPDHLFGDPSRLRQILLNLTDNAIKFTQQGDVMLRVAVESATDAEHCLHFSITDTGIGIPEAKQALIFEAFSQADGTTTRTYGGTGLGLTIASQLVRKMGGRIWVESIVGKGTAFHFTACLSARDTPVPSARQAELSRVEGWDVLVVDDNAINRRILSEMLEGWMMHPRAVATGAAAIEELLRAARAGAAFPLVILDSMMPEMDGFTVAEKIREHAELTGATVMMLSSGMPAGSAARCAEVGIASYLTKPVSQSELLNAILVAVGEGPEPETADASAPAPQAGEGVRILLVEDNLINRTLAAGILAKRGHSLTYAANGREAVDAAARGTFDLILMDVQMPEMNGIDATGRIREMELAGHSPRVPIVAMTAHAMTGDRERCLAAGMDDYLSKPLKKAALLALIEQRARPRSEPESTARADAGDAPWREDGSAPAAIFSRQQLLEQVDDDESLLGRMIALYVQNTPEALTAIRGAIARADSGELARSAHGLLSSLGAFGALPAHRLARQLEELGRQGTWTGANAIFGDLEREAAQVSAALEVLV